MSLEDNFLKLDTNNYNNELFYRLDNNQLTLDDCIDLLVDGYITKETLLDCCEYLIHRGLQGQNKSCLDIDKETL